MHDCQLGCQLGSVVQHRRAPDRARSSHTQSPRYALRRNGAPPGGLPLSLLALSHQPVVTHSDYTCAMLARPAHHAPRLDASRHTPGALHPEPKFNVAVQRLGPLHGWAALLATKAMPQHALPHPSVEGLPTRRVSRRGRVGNLSPLNSTLKEIIAYNEKHRPPSHKHRSWRAATEPAHRPNPKNWMSVCTARNHKLRCSRPQREGSGWEWRTGGDAQLTRFVALVV